MKETGKGFNFADFLKEPDFVDVPLKENNVTGGESRACPNQNSMKNMDRVRPYLENLSNGDIHFIDKTPIIVGASVNCDLVIGDEESSSYISRNHAVIDIIDGQYALKDISTNGSFFLNEDGRNPTLIRLPKDSFTELKHRQIIRFAKRNYRFMNGGE